jgi:oligopeptide/dipeptide ABC transporter ATP-binding protein
MNNEIILELENFSVKYYTVDGVINAVNNINLKIKKGEMIGIAGESGCGKSTLGYGIIKLLPYNAKIYGKILFDGEDLTLKNEKEMQKIRGGKISMVFQDPMTSLNPLYRVKDQFLRILKIHKKMDKEKGLAYAKELLKEVELPDPEQILESFPYELSGGMQQRVMIAMALSSDPELIIADEPTTAIDATIQAQILRLLKKLNKERNLSIILITHNLGIIIETCNRVVIMYAGNIVESGPIEKVFLNPLHPYTQALLYSIPHIGKTNKNKDLPTIPGEVPNLLNLPKGCVFYPRCKYAIEICKENSPKLIEYENDHLIQCHLFNKSK